MATIYLLLLVLKSIIMHYEVLWGIFGGTINEKGYKVLNPKVGIIYGDSITLERQKEIYKRLEERGFAATNLVQGNQDLPLVVIDDLCIAQLLESHYPNRDRVIYVTHMVNPKGIATLSENYKEVYFTNSYRDWEQEALPDNVKVIKVV